MGGGCQFHVSAQDPLRGSFYLINGLFFLFLLEYFPSRVVSFAVVLMTDTTADHETVLSVAVSLLLRHIWELAVLHRTGG